MRSIALYCALIVPFGLAACDSNKEPIVEPSKNKSVGELKQASKKNEMSKEELEEARRKAGFKSHEETMAEAKAAYEKEEKVFVKTNLEAYRKMSKELRASLDSVEKGAAKWAKAKDPDAAHSKWNEKYAEKNKEFIKNYRELTEKESRGGDVQVTLGGFVTAWENFNGDLSGKIEENEKFASSLAELRKVLDELDGQLDAIEKDESIEAEKPEEDEK